MLTVILVRHGETEWNQLRRLQGGNSNVPLNENGMRQAEYLASRLKLEKVEAIYSSPLRRSVETAQAIAEHHEIGVNLEIALREIDIGKLEGTLIDDLGKSFTELLITTSKGEMLPRVPDGESLSEVQQRAWSVIQRLVSQHPDGTIVVVSHYFIILTIICSALNLPLPQIGRLRVVPGSISTLIFNGQSPRLVLLNDTCHLSTD